MGEIVVRAGYATVAREAGAVIVGFAEGEDESEPYALFRELSPGGAVWFEVNDEIFGAENAVARLVVDEGGLTVEIAPGMAASFGFARRIRIAAGPDCDGYAAALKALGKMAGLAGAVEAG